jgi:hypothetical protein
VMKKETLNKNIHIIAEGMGALAVLQIATQLPAVRSVVMISPCIDLKRHVEFEKEHKFFYKRLMRELQTAYETDEETIESVMKTTSFHHYFSVVPVKIWVSIHERKEKKALYREYEKKQERDGGIVSLSFYMQETKYGIGSSICQFYKRYEKDL